MLKFNEIKLTYTCPAAPPSGMFMDRLYSMGKDEKGLYFTDGNYTEYAEEWLIKMFFTPKDTTWDKVDFTDVVEKVEFMKNSFKK